MRLCVSLSRGVAAPLGCVICLQLGDVAVFSLCAQYFLNVRGGGGITTLGPFRTVTNIPGPGIRTAYFAALGAWSGVLPKNAGSLGTAMCLCVSLFRGVAAPLGCVIFFSSVEIVTCMPCVRVRGMGGITTLSALYVLPKRRTAACQNSSFAVF